MLRIVVAFALLAFLATCLTACGHLSPGIGNLG